MFAAVVIAKVVSAMSGQHCVKLIYGILGGPGANIFHFHFKGVLPRVSHEGTPAPLLLLQLRWDSPPPLLLRSEVVLYKTGLNLKEHHHCGKSLL